MVMYKITFPSATAIIVLLILLFQLIFVYDCSAQIQYQNSTDISNMSVEFLSTVSPVSSSSTDNETVTVTSSSKIEPELLQHFQDKDTTTFIVSMKKPEKSPLDDFATQSFATRDERLKAFNMALTESTQESQKNVLDFLEMEKARRSGTGTGTGDTDSSGFTHESLPISNQILVSGGDLKLAKDLEPFDEVIKISHDHELDNID